MQSLFFEVNGVRLHAMTDGPEKGPLIVLLHGFPDFWYGWRNQIPFLAKAGFRVVAVDQRGYNLSSKPHGSAAYRLSTLTTDIENVIEKCGAPAAVVGHDWGGAVTWSLALRRPDLVRRFVVLNCPHPKAMMKRLLGDPRQALRSWYLFFFQLPLLPETLLRSRKFGALAEGLKALGPEAFSRTDLERYREAWSQPRALSGGLNWYRAMKFSGPPRPHRRLPPSPGMLVWGTADAYLRTNLADDSAKCYPDLRVEKWEGVGHWVPQQEPARLNALLQSYLKQ
jgi:pimeloyl-ACP methyl ester carboxylesterase